MISEPIRLRVWGPYACFTRPEFHVERVSYPIITPSAARGILEAVLMKPVEKPESTRRCDKEGFRWHIQRIGIVHEGSMMSILRNELGFPEHNYTGHDINDMGGVRTQRHSLILQGDEMDGCEKRIEYLIEAAIEANSSSLGKYTGTFERRARKGQCYHRPYFGCREFPCNFELAPDGEPDSNINESYGTMFNDFDFNPVWEHWNGNGNVRPVWWRDSRGRKVSPTPVKPLLARASNGWIVIAPAEASDSRNYEVEKP